MSFAQNFCYCLEENGLSPYAFAKIIGVSNQGVLNWTKGISLPYPKTQQKIADYFGITVEALMGDELPVLPPEGAKKAPDPEIEGGREAVSNFISATNDRAALLAIINEATKKLQEME
jgi:transcriptional regulator with XRE-family HTH domain